jgi:hypothetical protein
VPNDFIQDVAGSFSAPNFSGISATAVWLVLAGVAVLVALALFLRARRAREAARRSPPTWILDPALIRSIFDEALTHRGRVDLGRYDLDHHRKSMPCALVKVESGGVILETPASRKLGDSWNGKQVYCFFSVPLKEDYKKMFYNFSSVIKQVKRQKGGSTHIRLAFPEKLVMGQKRRTLRIKPALDQAPELYIWPLTPANEDILSEYLDRGPQAARLPADASHRVLNISGGGIRAESSLNSKGSRDLYDYNVGRSYLVGLGLAEADSEPVRYGFVAKVVNMFDDFRNVEVGLQFQARYLQECDAHGRPVSSPMQESDDEVEQWVIEQNLRMFREKGVAE